MRILLGSGGYRTTERVALLADAMREFFGSIERILFVPYALDDHDGYVEMLKERGLDAGYRLDGIHKHADPVQAVREAEAIYVGGGNTFRLLETIYRLGLFEAIRDRVRNGLPYLGVSAGSNLACPTIKTTNDMPIVQPPSFDAFGFVPFQLNPHYYTGDNYVLEDGEYRQHFGETRDVRIREFHEENDLPVVGLWEAGILKCVEGKIELIGQPARIFRKQLAPVDVQPGTELSSYFA